MARTRPQTEKGLVESKAPPVDAAAFAAGLMELSGATEWKNILIYGGSGAGKTGAASQLPGRVLYLAGEPGYIAAANLGGKGHVRIIPDTATALAAVSWLEDGHAAKYDWVVPDGLSTLNVKFLLGYAAEAFDLNPRSRAHRNLPDKPDYFNTQNFTKGWVARLIDLPVNVLFTAHAMHPEIAGEEWVYPAIQGKGHEVSNYVCGLMHCVGYMSRRERDDTQVRRILWETVTRDDITYFAKDQFDRLPRFTDVYDYKYDPQGLRFAEILDIMDGKDKPARTKKGR